MFGFCLLAMRISRGTSQSGSRMESGNAGSMLFFCGGDGGGNGRGRVVGKEHHNHGSVETGGIFERSLQLEIRPMFH